MHRISFAFRNIIFLLSLILLPSHILAEEVKIGIIMPLTGNQAVFGVDAKRMLDIIAPNGSLKRQDTAFTFHVEDGQCGIGNSASTAANKLIYINKVHYLVVGCSGEMMQVAPMAERDKVVTIGFISSHPDIREIGDYIFRTYIDMRKAIKLISDLILKEQSGGIAVLTEDSTFTMGIKDILLSHLKDRVVFEEDFNVDEVSFRSLLQKSRAKNPAAYYLNTASPRTYLNLYKQLRASGIKLPVYSYHAPSDPEVLKELGTKQDGVKFVTPPEVEGGSEEFQTFFKSYIQAHPEGPGIDFALRSSFDALHILIKAIAEHGDNPEKVKDYIYKVKTDGAIGKLSFDSYGDIENVNYALKEIKDGLPITLIKSN